MSAAASDLRPRRRLLAGAVALAAATAGLLAVTSPEESAASVSVNQVYRVPDSGTYTVRGHGYGHGNGMSQHGAQGAALRGLNAQQILAFYYPGTVKTIAKAKNIRVLVSADTTDPVEVMPRDGLRVRDLGAKTSYELPTGVNATRWRLRADASNRNVVEYYRSGWRSWQPGGRAALQGVGEFFSTVGPVTLVTPSGQVAYRGALRAAPPTPTSTARDTVNVVSLDDYVKGVIPAEMPPLWNKYAVRAQAVAARTYAAFDRNANFDRYYQICDTTRCQVYKGTALEHPASNQAAAFTAGQIRTYQGEPAFTQFSASSGGWTSAGSRPYLVSKEDPYDDWAGNSHHDWTVNLTAKRIRDAYPAIGQLLRVRVTKREGGGEWQGRVETLVLEGTKAKRTLSGDTFRYRFGLKSTWFRL
jgi:stage II sporulation protein D